MKKIIAVFLLLITLSYSISIEYHPSREFAKYFTTQNCSQVLDKFYYLNCYDYNYKGTKAIAYRLESDNLKAKQIKKRPRFEDDTNIPKKYRTTWSDYKNSGYDRGHMAPNASFSFNKAAQKSVFLMSNIIPQNPHLNQSLWKKLEKRERDFALRFKEVEVLNLVLYSKNPKKIKNDIAIPKSFIKIIKIGKFKECYKVSNEELKNQNIRNYRKECESILN
ncbi:TPA: DNA/RNA non-specific endonuclease [Campylobacter jejuni]|nr:DNA/RNA non-specific endonuclease [Campylobacter jejuni]ECP8671840.1 DNA/RNA non-specific endonuclease [Campylobacter jejuni]HEC2489170.1 DNA/RNA non-specific endonuclease [Campylobacter jejuni]HEC2492127.1 DNA/RNA non-specific endonuclease [Campylobacter jejuni]HEC2492558.1 DNA/RNA non-specific endonuclease [Campylobacter jejuni]